MPHRGMRAAHSPFAGVIDSAHQQQRQSIARRQTKFARYLTRLQRQLHRPLTLLIRRFFENARFERFDRFDPFQGYPNRRTQIGIAICIDRPHFVSALRQKPRQYAGNGRLAASAFSRNRDFHQIFSRKELRSAKPKLIRRYFFKFAHEQIIVPVIAR